MSSTHAALVAAKAAVSDLYMLDPVKVGPALTALDAALAQAEAAQPVAWRWRTRHPTDAPGFVSPWMLSATRPPITATEVQPLYAAPQPAEAAPKQEAVALTERDHHDFALWFAKLGTLADAYYETGTTAPARRRARAALMLHAADAATGWRARSALAAQPQQPAEATKP